jgi:tripartite-type tricarboxylate transporter receptor subunit TctC
MGRDVPLASSLARTDIDRAAIDLLTSVVALGRPFVAPPGVPAERISALRRAFDATMKDPEFLAYAAKAKLDILPLGGEKVQEVVARVISTPAAALARTKELIQSK